jgi:predicted nucleic acid-binding protein
VSLVLDASLTLSWYFDDERTADADALLDQVADHGACVPSLWRLEVANGFQVAIRRKRLDAAFRDNALGQLNRMPIVVDSDTDMYAWSTTLRLAERFQLTLYDAAYLELAQRRHLPLATLDQPLRVAGGALSIGLLGMPK